MVSRRESIRHSAYVVTLRVECLTLSRRTSPPEQVAEPMNSIPHRRDPSSWSDLVVELELGKPGRTLNDTRTGLPELAHACQNYLTIGRKSI